MLKRACPLQSRNLKIRPLERAHNEELYRLIRGILESYGLDKPGTAYFDPELAQLSGHYQQENAAYFVMVDGKGHVIGGVGIAPFSEGVAELQKLYLHEDYRGQGLGEMLLRRALVFAKSRYQSVYLETHSTLKEAVPLYEKLGFRPLEAPYPGSPHSTMDIWMLYTFGGE